METYVNETRNGNYTVFPNETDYDESGEEDVIFDRTYVRIIFVGLHTVVFCLCFFGNLLVILVVTLSRRLRSITNFFLANLAVADFCVGVFCVYQNLMIYITEWNLGKFLCKMYQFTNSFSYTASILILVVICTERYFAIIYPITCKQILTSRRLRLAIVAVWITSVIYSSPKFFWVTTVTNIVGDKTETICISHRQKYNSEIFDMINFALLYVIPLAVMSLLYTRIAICLWRSSRQLEKQLNASTNNNPYQSLNRRQSSRYKHHQSGELKQANNEGTPIQGSNGIPNATSSQNVLKARRGVIRMLIIVVCTFAVCNLPLHARKMWQYWSKDYKGDSNFSAVLTPLTFLITYVNSAVNPLLYAFLSRNFRRGMREILFCSFGRNRTPLERNHHAYDLRIRRNASTRSTVKANTTTVTVLNNERSSEGSHEL